MWIKPQYSAFVGFNILVAVYVVYVCDICDLWECAQVCAHGGQRRILIIFLDCSPSYSLERGPLQNLGVPIFSERFLNQ